MAEPRPLPELMTVQEIMVETGRGRRAAEALMRACPKQHIPGFRRVYVRRSDLHAVLDRERHAA